MSQHQGSVWEETILWHWDCKYLAQYFCVFCFRPARVYYVKARFKSKFLRPGRRMQCLLRPGFPHRTDQNSSYASCWSRQVLLSCSLILRSLLGDIVWTFLATFHYILISQIVGKFPRNFSGKVPLFFQKNFPTYNPSQEPS